MHKISLLFGLLFLMTACAYSPQIISVTPQVVVDQAMVGQGRVIRVEAIDRRENPVLGTLGGIYGDTSGITLANNVEKALEGSVSDALVQLGFVVDTSYQGDLRLVVHLDELVYSSPDNLYSNKVEMQTAVSIEATNADKTYIKTYRSKGEKRFVAHPDKEANQQQINALLSKTLERIFKDTAFLMFISA